MVLLENCVYGSFQTLSNIFCVENVFVDGDMDDELEADLYDKLTKLTADDIQEVVNAIDN